MYKKDFLDKAPNYFKRHVLPLYKKTILLLNENNIKQQQREFSLFQDKLEFFLSNCLDFYFKTYNVVKINEVRSLVIQHINPETINMLVRLEHIRRYSNLPEYFFRLNLYSYIDLRKFKNKWFHSKDKGKNYFSDYNLSLFACVNENYDFWQKLNFKHQFKGSILWKIFFKFLSIKQPRNAFLVYEAISYKVTHTPSLSEEILCDLAPSLHHPLGEDVWNLFLKIYPNFFKNKYNNTKMNKNKYYKEVYSYCEHLYFKNPPYFVCEDILTKGELCIEVTSGWGSRNTFFELYLPHANFESFNCLINHYPDLPLTKNRFNEFFISKISDADIFNWYCKRIEPSLFYQQNKYQPIGQIMALAFYKNNLALLDNCLLFCQKNNWSLDKIIYKSNRLDLLLNKYKNFPSANLSEMAFYNCSSSQVSKILKKDININQVNQSNCLPVWVLFLNDKKVWYYQLEKSKILKQIIPYVNWNMVFEDNNNAFTYFNKTFKFSVDFDDYLKIIYHYNWTNLNGFSSQDLFIFLQTILSNILVNKPQDIHQKIEDLFLYLLSNIQSQQHMVLAKNIIQLSRTYVNKQDIILTILKSFCIKTDMTILTYLKEHIIPKKTYHYDKNFTSQAILLLEESIFKKSFIIEKQTKTKIL